jgi:hypothetical protein
MEEKRLGLLLWVLYDSDEMECANSQRHRSILVPNALLFQNAMNGPFVLVTAVILNTRV